MLREGMETLDENLFDLLLSFLTPREAECLAGVSKSLRAMAEDSLRWKVWCEQACPGLKTSPATELVSAHFEKAKRGPGFYRGLFLELNNEGRTLVQLPGPSVFDQDAGQCKDSSLQSPNLGEFLMVMDVFLGGECILSCSAGAEAVSCAERELAVTASGLTPNLEEFEWGTFFSSRSVTPFEFQAASEASLDTLIAAIGYCTESTLPQLSMNWRLLRKSDMRLLNLLKGAPILVIHRRSHCEVKYLVIYAFGEGQFPRGPNRIVALMQLSKVGAPWRTYRFSRWLHLQGQKVTVDCFN
jgi:hypothetical protein